MFVELCLIVMVLFVFFGVIAIRSRLKKQFDTFVLSGVMFIIAGIMMIAFVPVEFEKMDVDIVKDLDDNQVYYVYNVSILRNQPDSAILVIQKVDSTTGTFFGRVCLYEVPRAELPDRLETPVKIIYQDDNIKIWTPPFSN
ncbi:hypothetical protein KAU40_02480 [Candidatus Parcubacteria bacterium]|nr:hypothetical protein [Candidatus Parcubacteria bacterium]